MNEQTRDLYMLQVAVPANTPLTVGAEIKVLELLGIVKDPQLITSMQLASALVPPSTPATLKGLVQLLGNLMRMSRKAKSSHHRSIATILSRLDAFPDSNLTFGTFLSVCQKLIESSGKTHEVHYEKHDPKAK
jgi:hypothetical protein